MFTAIADTVATLAPACPGCTDTPELGSIVAVGGIATLGLAFGAGALGSGHCVGMCGAFVVGLGRCVPQRPWRSQLVYAAGRTLAYGFFGAILGLLGSFALIASRIRHLQGWVLLVAGAVVIGLAVTRIGWGEGPILPASAWQGRLARLRAMVAPAGTTSVFALGGLNALIPCGLLYAMGLEAAASGSPIHGMAIMMAFGLGTSPALVVLGNYGGKLSRTKRLALDRAASVILVVLGAQLIARGVTHMGWIN